MAEAATSKGFKAIMVGATGVTGKYLLAELIRAKEFSDITVLGRREAGLPDDATDINLEEETQRGRVVQTKIDFEKISVETLDEHFKGCDVFFSCLGTTRKQAGSAEAFRHIDYDYNYNLAKVAKEMNVRMYSLMSSANANKDSMFLYLKTKGQLDHDCGLLEFPQYAIYRPGLLDRGKDAKLVEKLAALVMTKISVSKIAQAMVATAIEKLNSPLPEKPEQILYQNPEILKISEAYKPSNGA